ncbi:NeuD/PglB/VioB family sugar acetyltransferase [Geomesophilobacter sediminis]|uniref:NeuD/PglB/VioB family sugar acetyltransferase n=1 Tax=Geomesophilobacter sediminis TaxID=2798584 RepID=A0A8J7S7K9_9BACT|nr:NeuD/PglB/VioB family sugar acetyltransferase [Geomesophilobacter sediminis]MBJ6727091.1 NeuD/PglB/VioB family sugar acetyltransferase [Geomesophilobacter sediminis]
MPVKKLLLFPFSGNARESLAAVMEANRREPSWELIGFIDDAPSTHGMSCCGVKVVGGREILVQMPETFVLAVPGSPESFNQRKGLIDSLNLPASRFATVMHPSACRAADANIGINTLIMSNVVVSCGVTIGNHCIILPNTVISHDSIVNEYCCIGSNISISGGVSIGANCYVGSGTKIKEKVTIGAGSLVGLGSNVISDIDAGVIAAGNPARVIKRLPPHI